MVITCQNLLNLREGDEINVTTIGGLTETGLFLKIENDHLFWVLNNQFNHILTVTRLDGISISKS